MAKQLARRDGGRRTLPQALVQPSTKIVGLAPLIASERFGWQESSGNQRALLSAVAAEPAAVGVELIGTGLDQFAQSSDRCRQAAYIGKVTNR